MTEPEAWAAHLPPHEETAPMDKIDTSTAAVGALMDGVTPGPWRIKNCDAMGDRCNYYYQEVWNDETDILVTTEVTRAHNDGGVKNMRFIAAARALVPALLAERDDLRAKLDAAVEALEGSREIILGLVNSRGSEAEGTDEDWVGEIDAALAALKGGDA